MSKERRNNNSSGGTNIFKYIFLVISFGLALIQVAELFNKPTKIPKLPDASGYSIKKKHVPKLLSQVRFDSTFKFIGYDGRVMTYVSSQDTSGPERKIKEVALAIAKPNPFEKTFILTGAFEEINNFKIVDLNNDVVYGQKEAYIKNELIILPALSEGTYFIKGMTDNGPVLTELMKSK